MKILWPDFQTENAVNGIVNRFHSITWVSCNQFLFFLYGDPIKSNSILPGLILFPLQFFDYFCKKNTENLVCYLFDSFSLVEWNHMKRYWYGTLKINCTWCTNHRCLQITSLKLLHVLDIRIMLWDRYWLMSLSDDCFDNNQTKLSRFVKKYRKICESDCRAIVASLSDIKYKLALYWKRVRIYL